MKRLKTYLEAVRGDDSSHLNDGLSANRKSGGYDYNDDSTQNYDDWSDWYDEEDDDYYAGRSSNPKFDSDIDDDYYDEDSNDDDVEHLNYLLRQMFRNAGVNDVRVTAKGNEDILIEVNMMKKETLRDVIKVFEVANKLKRDILAQYVSEFDIWQHRNGGVILNFSFTLGDKSDNDLPF
jgi:hypothetical protein